MSEGPEHDAVGGRTARATQRDKVYLDLKRMLMLGSFPAGASLPVRKLCEELGVGTMPVRDAVQRLAAEGALDALPNGRLRVPLLETAEIEELFALRLLIEPHAAARAAEARPAKRSTVSKPRSPHWSPSISLPRSIARSSLQTSPSTSRSTG